MIIIKGVAIFDLIIRNEISEPKKAGKMECVVDFKSFPFLVCSIGNVMVAHFHRPRCQNGKDGGWRGTERRL